MSTLPRKSQGNLVCRKAVAAPRYQSDLRPDNKRQSFHVNAESDAIPSTFLHEDQRIAAFRVRDDGHHNSVGK